MRKIYLQIANISEQRGREGKHHLVSCSTTLSDSDQDSSRRWKLYFPLNFSRSILTVQELLGQLGLCGAGAPVQR